MGFRLTLRPKCICKVTLSKKLYAFGIFPLLSLGNCPAVYSLFQKQHSTSDVKLFVCDP